MALVPLHYNGGNRNYSRAGTKVISMIDLTNTPAVKKTAAPVRLLHEGPIRTHFFHDIIHKGKKAPPISRAEYQLFAHQTRPKPKGKGKRVYIDLTKKKQKPPKRRHILYRSVVNAVQRGVKRASSTAINAYLSHKRARL